MLNADQQRRWRDEGFIVLPGFKSEASIAALRERAYAIVEAFEPDRAAGVFSTVAPERLADAALLASAAEVHCFFEEEAFDAVGRLRRPKAQSINKIGHALHDRDPVFERFSHGPELAALAADLGLPRPQVWQSMLIFKQPHIGGEVRWHQDATYLITEPASVVGFWFALEDATRDNGCLWVQPGGHRSALREIFTHEPRGLTMTRLDPTPWPTQDEALPVEVEAGALVAFHGLLPHYSAPNRSPRSRLAYTLHASDASSNWSAKNWLQRPASLPVRGFD